MSMQLPEKGFATPIAHMLAGVAPGDPVKRKPINSLVELKHELGASVAEAPKAMLTRISALRPNESTGDAGKVVSRLAIIAQQLLVQTGRIEAEYIRRPNILAAVYTTVLAPGQSVAFSVTPGLGNSYYRILEWIPGEQQSEVMGFTSLRIGGQEHVQYNQTTPAPPVANFVPWYQFALKESSLKTNLAPWAGYVFDSTIPLAGTIANGTVAGSGDAVTLAARIGILCQSDPCGRRYVQMIDASNRYWGSFMDGLDAYAPLMTRRSQAQQVY